MSKSIVLVLTAGAALGFALAAAAQPEHDHGMRMPQQCLACHATFRAD